MGTEIYVGNLAVKLAALGHHVHCVYGTRTPATTHDISSLCVHPITQSGTPFARTLGFRRKCAHVLGELSDQSDLDAMVFFGPGTYAAHMAKQLNPRTLVVYYAMDSMRSERARQRMSREYVGLYRLRQETRYWALITSEKNSCVRADMVLASSKDTARHLVSDYGLNDSKIRVLYEGVPDDFSSGISPLEPRIPTFVHVGGPPRKGTDVFLDALGKLNSGGFRVSGVITRARACDKQRIRELGVPVITHRFLNRLSYRELLASCTALVCSSYSEGFCLPIVEAAMFGKPAIVTDTGSLPELVTDGQNGFVVPVGDAALLADRMYELANDAELRESMSTNAMEYSKRFTIGRAVLDLLSLIQLATTNRVTDARNL